MLFSGALVESRHLIATDSCGSQHGNQDIKAQDGQDDAQTLEPMQITSVISFHTKEKWHVHTLILVR